MIQHSALSAFYGAFFAFLFIRLADLFRELYTRERTYFRALANLEYLFNRHLGELTDNIHELNQISETNKAAKENGTPFLIANWPREISNPTDIIDGLLNIDLINDIFAYTNRVKRINNDFTRFNCLNEEVRKAFLAGTIDNPTYTNFVQKSSDGLEKLNKFLEDIRKDAIDLLSKVRVLQKNAAPLLDRVFRKISKRKYPNKFPTLVLKEQELLMSEIKESIENGTKKAEFALKQKDS